MPNKSKSKRKHRAYYYYECPECSSKWMNSIAGKDINRKCRHCKIAVQPYKQTEKPEIDPNFRCFGHYKCTECNRTWMSANSWVGYGQECLNCNINIMAHIQTPLRSSRGGDVNKSHLSELCEKCKRIGHSCRKVKN